MENVLCDSYILRPSATHNLLPIYRGLSKPSPVKLGLILYHPAGCVVSLAPCICMSVWQCPHNVIRRERYHNGPSSLTITSFSIVNNSVNLHGGNVFCRCCQVLQLFIKLYTLHGSIILLCIAIR